MKYKENMISVQFIYVLQHVIHVLHQFNRPFFFHFFFSIFFHFFPFPPFFSSDSWKKFRVPPSFLYKNFASPPLSGKIISRSPLNFTIPPPGVNNDRSLRSDLPYLSKFQFLISHNVFRLAPTTKIKPFLDSLKKELSKNVYFYYGRVYTFQVVSL